MKLAIPDTIATTIAADMDLAIERTERISGGCIHHTYCLHTGGGKLFLKYNRLEQATSFEIEAKGLALLADSHTLTIPNVLHHGQVQCFAYLVMDWVDQGRQGRDYWPFFGEQLAQMHQQSQPRFGLEDDNYIGTLPQRNTFEDDWVTFFVTHRLQPMVRMAVERDYLDRRDVNRFEKLYEKLPGMFPKEPPALLHGDLWGGNILVGTDGHPVLIDPAVHYGHREMELAFMKLFDRQPPTFLDAYESVYPLAKGWEDRVDLCHLYPLLVHVNLFGGSYIHSLREALGQYV